MKLVDILNAHWRRRHNDDTLSTNDAIAAIEAAHGFVRPPVAQYQIRLKVARMDGDRWINATLEQYTGAIHSGTYEGRKLYELEEAQ